MSVSEYRNLIDAVGQAHASLRGCRHDERQTESMWLRRTLDRLCNAELPKRIKQCDRERAANAIKFANESLANI
jgi:Ser/Thr protein kinase RdoA (MazF antagonist)